MLRCLACMALVAVLTGCGQKGPLYLPKPSQPATTDQQPVEQPAASDLEQNP